ncbi:FAD-dependent oxidoreductase [Longispora sp. K20-0274]|uniref:phytoene desaturase family protein n=1 Tax=Longispora sp. K20-0274 TaxID=3088255 RepID=UPI003999CF8C
MTNAKLGTDGWDAVVIGAGHNGLTCAAYLAVAGGLRVLVVERQATAGGDDAAAVPTVYQGLGLDDRFRFWEPLPHWEPDGLDALPARTAGGWDTYRARMVAALPEEAAQVCRYVDTCSALHAEIRGMDPEGTAAPSPLFVTCARKTLDQVMGDCGLSSRARTVLGGGEHGLGPEQVPAVSHAAMLGDQLHGDTGPALDSTLVEAIEAYGGEVRTRTPVVGVTVESGQVTGVRTVAGDVLRAPVVVADPDDGRFLDDLVGDRPDPAAGGYRAVASAASTDLVGRALLDYAERTRGAGRAPGAPMPAGGGVPAGAGFGEARTGGVPAGGPGRAGDGPAVRRVVPDVPGLHLTGPGTASVRTAERILDGSPVEANAGRVYGSPPRATDRWDRPVDRAPDRATECSTDRPSGRIPRPRVRR